MSTSKRWMNNAVQEAANCETKMPWERGARRQAFIAKRLENEHRPSKITLAPLPAWMTEEMSA